MSLHDSLTLLELACRNAREAGCMAAAMRAHAETVPRLAIVDSIRPNGNGVQAKGHDPHAQAVAQANAARQQAIVNLIAVLNGAQAVVPLVIPVLREAGLNVQEGS